MGIPGCVLRVVPSHTVTDSRRLAPAIEECEETIPIAQLAQEHFQRKGRPLKIAIYEADWRFNNVSPEQVAAIRRGVFTLPHNDLIV
jgi:hypothetical protein